MELNQMIELIHTISESNLTQFSMEEGNLKISMKTNKQIKTAPASAIISAAPLTQPGVPVQENSSPAALAPSTQENIQEETISGNIVKSPLVGTFYNAPSPEAEAFVKPGDKVKKGQVLGIVEAMKLMNEIESEFEGTVEKILVSNEGVVEYGQPLFVIK